MCKHSKDGVDTLAKRQRGLDARGNDPLATKRESSWATDFIKDPPGKALKSTISYLKGFPETGVTDTEKARMAHFKQGLTGLGDQPTGMQFANFFADGQNTQFKEVIDDISGPIGKSHNELDLQGRNQPFFVDRGRMGPQRMRRQSMDSRHVGITTSNDRTADTKDQYQGAYFHAQTQFRGKMDSDTVKKFQKSGAPFIGGASGTIHAVAVEMEVRGKVPVAELDPAEIQERERVLAMLSVQHVAAGHHSMSECLVAAQTYGYFKDVPDPLTNYDSAMQGLEQHLQGLGLGRGGMAPLSRASETQDKGKSEVKHDDRRSFVKTYFERYQDQLKPEDAQKIQAQLDAAATDAGRKKFGDAIKRLDKAENMIRGQAALITAQARGSSQVLSPDQLTAKVREASQSAKAAKDSSPQYKAVTQALAQYDTSMKQLGGRKMNHDRAGLAFEVLRVELLAVETAIQTYRQTFKDSPDKAAHRKVMDDLRTKIAREKALLDQAEAEIGHAEEHDQAYKPLAGDVSIAESIEYARFGVNPGTQARPDALKQSRVTGQTVLGKGGLNTVMLVDYQAEGGKPAEQRAFKPEPERNTTHPHMLNDLGIDPNNPKFGKRNIASKKMAEAAGLGSLIPAASFTIIDGKVGLAMEKAAGGAPVKRVVTAVKDPLDSPDLREAALARQNKERDWKTKIPEKSRGGMRYGFDDKAGQFTVEAARVNPLPLKPPADPKQVAAMQKQMVDLQWLDALCGQTDRHEENYVVDTSQEVPAIVGIDNDFSFGAKRTDPDTRASNALGFPPIIDEATYASLKKMDWTTIAAALDAELYSVQDNKELAARREPKREIEAAKSRFDKVQQKLDELKTAGRVLKSWDDTVDGRSVTDFLLDLKSAPTYYQRDAMRQDELLEVERRQANAQTL